eukprot:CAMPEP_0184320554 /NCGR_PEP_ID=MMETSP1049-20130417/114489_1 /TAXON_ID=77928 /ORGANISM="Proteomonas sulcata, Strain CCMP704" /LENGTH=39 /DNA_ID= /DNA_START= /DNA_END= /DNA_ORIENTATION=
MGKDPGVADLVKALKATRERFAEEKHLQRGSRVEQPFNP